MTNREDAERCLSFLFSAIEAVDPEYCSVGYLDGSDSDTHRKFAERVFCYELYHQLRLCWNRSDTPEGVVVHGELWKSEDFFKSRLTGALEGRTTCPDLLIHEPGSMDRNLVAVEVKGSRCEESRLKKDINKLLAYLGGGKYEIGVLVLVGDRNPEELLRGYLAPGAPIRVVWKPPFTKSVRDKVWQCGSVEEE